MLSKNGLLTTVVQKYATGVQKGGMGGKMMSLRMKPGRRNAAIYYDYVEIASLRSQ